MRILPLRSTVLRTLPLLLASFLMIPTGMRAGTEAKASKPKKTEIAQPAKSEFAIPANPDEGRDPFYPKSHRPYKVPIVPHDTDPKPVQVILALKALSGTPERPLAIINDRTFAVGETADVRTSQNTKASVTCIEIDTDALKVRVKVGSDTRELSMHP